VSKPTYPLKLPLSIKKAAQRLAKEDGVSSNPMDRGRGRREVGAVETNGRLFQETSRQGHLRFPHFKLVALCGRAACNESYPDITMLTDGIRNAAGPAFGQCSETPPQRLGRT
jgi:hypothetical protein